MGDQIRIEIGVQIEVESRAQRGDLADQVGIERPIRTLFGHVHMDTDIGRQTPVVRQFGELGGWQFDEIEQIVDRACEVQRLARI